MITVLPVHSVTPHLYACKYFVWHVPATFLSRFSREDTWQRSSLLQRLFVDTFRRSGSPVFMSERSRAATECHCFKLKLFTEWLVIVLRPGVVYSWHDESWECPSPDQHLPVGCEGGAALSVRPFLPSHINHLQQMGECGHIPLLHIHDSKTLCLNLRPLKLSLRQNYTDVSTERE